MSGPGVPEGVEGVMCAHFGQQPSRASIAFVGVEPIEVLRFETAAGERAYLSLGMSRHSMTAASDGVVSPDGPRAELMLWVHADAGIGEGVWRQLAVLAAAPAVEGVVYAPGMTVDLGQPLGQGSRCTGVLVAESSFPAITTPEGAVTVLEVLPATSSELAWCRVHGAAALRERWADEQVDLRDLGRRPVTLV